MFKVLITTTMTRSTADVRPVIDVKIVDFDSRIMAEQAVAAIGRAVHEHAHFAQSAKALFK